MPAPLCLASCFLPLDDNNSRWWKQFQDELARCGMELILLSTAPAANRELRTILIPFCLRDYGRAYAVPPEPITLEPSLTDALARRDRTWVEEEHRDLAEYRSGLAACQHVLRTILHELQPAVVLPWGNSLPQSVVLQQLALQQGRACWMIERGLLPGTFMIEMSGQSGQSELNWSFALSRALQASTDTRLFFAAQAAVRNNPQTKYAQAEALSPDAFHARYNPGRRKLVAFAMQHDISSCLLPGDYLGAGIHGPAFRSAADALQALARAAREQNALVLAKPHPIDHADYSALETEHLRVLRDVNLQSLMTAADVVACMTSTTQFEALLLEKPLLLMARSQLAGKGAAYEALTPETLPGALRAALQRQDFEPRRAAARRFLHFVLQHYSVAISDSSPAVATLADLARFLRQNVIPIPESPSSAQGLAALGRAFHDWERKAAAQNAATPQHGQVACGATPVRAIPGPHRLELFRSTSRAEFEHVLQTNLSPRLQIQERLNPGQGGAFMMRGYCAVCGGSHPMRTDYHFGYTDANGRKQPSWRERQVCRCELNCRQRSCFHVLVGGLGLSENALIYCTEQTTELFRHIRRGFPLAIGSEFLGDKMPLGAQNEQGIRNEDITRLTFPDDAFDCVFSIDVLEHVPDYKAGLAELARCLKPGGKLLLTAPFHFGKDQTIIRAGVDAERKLTHYLPPVYHGDPLSTEGCLCFNDFGWDLLDDVANAGFDDVALHVFTSEEYGYVGLQYVLLATRQQVLWQRSTRRTLLREAAPKRPHNPQAELLNEPVETLLQRAYAASDQAQWDEAGRCFQALTNRQPDNVEFWRGRVQCSRQQGHSVLTDLIVEEALDRHPEWEPVLTAPRGPEGEFDDPSALSQARLQ